MKIKIYNYCNEETEIEINKEIKEIFVNIVSGDEIIDVEYEDGSREIYDSCPNDRIVGYDDGFYIIKKDKINEWNEMKFDNDSTYSYQRLDKFW